MALSRLNRSAGRLPDCSLGSVCSRSFVVVSCAVELDQLCYLELVQHGNLDLLEDSLNHSIHGNVDWIHSRSGYWRPSPKPTSPFALQVVHPRSGIHAAIDVDEDWRCHIHRILSHVLSSIHPLPYLGRQRDMGTDAPPQAWSTSLLLLC